MATTKLKQLTQTTNKKPWPPEEWQEKYRKFHEHSAWYSGSRQKLMRHYAIKGEPSDGAGDFWGTNLGEGESKTMVHVPVAGDIAGVSASHVLGSDPNYYIPEATEDDAEDQEAAKVEEDRLNEISEKMGLYPRLLEAAEGAASLGGVFLKINAKPSFKNFPILNVVYPDHAIPEWRWGFLTKVTFHRRVREKTNTVWRHLETHTPGTVINELFKGREGFLGTKISLSSINETSHLEPKVETGLDGLAATYVPNKKPNRFFRESNLGSSDYQGVEDLMDGLDEVYSDWLHEIEVGRARILASEEFLKNVDGEWIFDMDESVFNPLQMPPDQEPGIKSVQFDIRSKKYMNTALEFFARIISTAGYSPQSFGLDIEGRAQTGTALKLRKKKSERVKQMKQNFFRGGVEGALNNLMEIDAKRFDGSSQFKPKVEFIRDVEIDIKGMSEALRNIEMANAASNEVKIRLLHPDWSRQKVKKEVEKINEEQGVNVSAPDIRNASTESEE